MTLILKFLDKLGIHIHQWVLLNTELIYDPPGYVQPAKAIWKNYYKCRCGAYHEDTETGYL